MSTAGGKSATMKGGRRQYSTLSRGSGLSYKVGSLKANKSSASGSSDKGKTAAGGTRSIGGSPNGRTGRRGSRLLSEDNEVLKSKRDGVLKAVDEYKETLSVVVEDEAAAEAAAAGMLLVWFVVTVLAVAAVSCLLVARAADLLLYVTWF